MATQDLLTVLLLVIVFIGLFALIAYYIRMKHLQKMEIIKKGDHLFENNSQLENMKYTSLNYAILLIYLGSGILLSNFLVSHFYFKHQFVIYSATIGIFLGAGLLTFYFLIKNKD